MCRFITLIQLQREMLFGLSILICLFIDPGAAMWFWIALFPVQWLVGKLATKRAEAESERGGQAGAETGSA